MTELTLGGNGRGDVQAWDGARGTQPPASRYAAARLVTGHVGKVRRASARGGIAASIDSSGLLICRGFDDPEHIIFSCRLREEAGVGVELFGPEGRPWLFACWKSGMALFERSGEGFELRRESSFDAGSGAEWSALAGGVVYVGFSGRPGIALGRIEAGGEGAPSIAFPVGELALPAAADASRFAIGPSGEVACCHADGYELFLVDPDGALRWSRRFPNLVRTEGIAFNGDGTSIAVCEGPALRELDARSGRDRPGSPIARDGKRPPVSAVYAGPDRIAVGNYQTAGILERAGSGSWNARLSSEWLVPGSFSAICRDGNRFLAFHCGWVARISDGRKPVAHAIGEHCAGALSLAFQGSALHIADASGWPKALDLGELSALIGSYRVRKDPYCDPLWPQTRRGFRRSGGRLYSIWSNSVDEETTGASTAFDGKVLRCADFSEEFGLAAFGGYWGAASIFRWEGGEIGEELCSFAHPSEGDDNDVANLLFAGSGRDRFLVCVSSDGTIARFRLRGKGAVDRDPLIGRVAKSSQTDSVAADTIFPVPGGFGLGVQHSSESVQFFSLEDLGPLMPPIGLGNTCEAVVLSGGKAIFGSAAGAIFEYSIGPEGCVPLRSKESALGMVDALALSEDGRLLAVGGLGDIRVRILDASSWDELATIYLFGRDMIVATPPTEEDRAKGREFHAFYNPLRPDPTEDRLISFYHSKGEEIRAGTGLRLDPSEAEDRARISEYLETLYGTEAIASGDYGRRMVLDAIWRPRRAAAALAAGEGNKPAGLISGGAGGRALSSGAADGQEG
jgi:hypothetical protein